MVEILLKAAMALFMVVTVIGVLGFLCHASYYIGLMDGLDKASDVWHWAFWHTGGLKDEYDIVREEIRKILTEDNEFEV